MNQRSGGVVAAVAALVGMVAPAPAWAICREVTVKGSAAPTIDPDQAVMFIRESNVPVGDCMQPPLGGGRPDAGPVDGDAGAWVGVDGGGDAVDGGAGDAGSGVPDAGPGAGDAGATECRRGDAVTLIVQPHFSTGPSGASFALLMVTPGPPVISLGPEELFAQLWESTRPLEQITEETIEDEALGYQCNDPKFDSGGCGSDLGAGGGGGAPWVPDPPDPDGADAGLPEGPTLIGGYEVAVLGASDLGLVTAWLDEHDFRYTQEDVDAVAPYVAAGHTVVAVRIAVAGEVARGAFRPLAFTWEGAEIRLPAGISRRAAGGELAVVAYVVAATRLDFAGAHVSYAQPTDAAADGAARVLTKNELHLDLSQGMASDPGVTVGAPERHHDVVEIIHEVRIPSSACPNGGDNEFGCGCRAARRTGVPGFVLLGGFPLVLLLRRRCGRSRRR